MPVELDTRAAAPPPTPPAPDTDEDARARSDGLQRSQRALAILLPLVLLLVAATVRFYRLDIPADIYFDETYYATDANQLLARGVEEGFAVHPPVGKWLIGAGIAVFGFEAFGWRAAAAAAGTLTVLMTYLAGLRLFRRRGIAALAALLVAVDGLALTMSRIAMLDIFLALFVTTGFWLLLVDRDEQWAGVPVGPSPGGEAVALPRRPHRYRWLAGVAFGLALATKWSAILAIGAAGLFVLVSELAWRRRLTGRVLTRPWRIVASGLLTLVAVPAVIYVASYAGWFANFEHSRFGEDRCPDGVCAMSVPDYAQVWWSEQQAIADFHLDLEADHPYRAPATTWPTLGRPVAYYYEACDDEKLAAGECVVKQGNVAEILGIGNPAVWWMALVAYPLLVWFGVTRRDWRAWALLVFLVGQYVPWLVTSRPVFLFYMTPVVPFIALALAYVAWRSLDPPLLRWLPAAIAVVAVAGFVFWYPLFTGLEIPKESWDLRIWTNAWI